jgi:hypothetical protein
MMKTMFLNQLTFIHLLEKYQYVSILILYVLNLNLGCGVAEDIIFTLRMLLGD